MSQNANELRRLAEAADGTRAKELYVVIENGKLALKKDKPAGDHAIIKTDWRSGGLRPSAASVLQVGGKPVSETADAVFTSQSAVEKFVLPYYMRMQSPEDLVKSVKDFYAANVIALYHEPESQIEKKKAGFHALFDDGTTKFIQP